LRRVTSEDSFIPLGPAANAVLLDEATIEQAAMDLIRSLPDNITSGSSARVTT